MTPLVSATGVSHAYGATQVLHGVSLTLYPGQLTLLMGPSGSGKSTLISVLVGALQPSAGRVVVCGEEITAMNEDSVSAVRRRHIGFVFQTDNLFPALSALENVAVIASMKGLSRRRALARARMSLVAVGLADRLHHKPGQLSGGQRQRVSLARAFALKPRLLVGDEVTAALDSTLAFQVADLVRRQVSPRTGALLVTHDARLVRFAHRVIHVEDGAISSDSMSPWDERTPLPRRAPKAVFA